MRYHKSDHTHVRFERHVFPVQCLQERTRDNDAVVVRNIEAVRKLRRNDPFGPVFALREFAHFVLQIIFSYGCVCLIKTSAFVRAINLKIRAVIHSPIVRIRDEHFHAVQFPDCIRPGTFSKESGFLQDFAEAFPYSLHHVPDRNLVFFRKVGFGIQASCRPRKQIVYRRGESIFIRRSFLRMLKPHIGINGHVQDFLIQTPYGSEYLMCNQIVLYERKILFGIQCGKTPEHSGVLDVVFFLIRDAVLLKLLQNGNRTLGNPQLFLRIVLELHVHRYFYLSHPPGNHIGRQHGLEVKASVHRILSLFFRIPEPFHHDLPDQFGLDGPQVAAFGGRIGIH